MHREYLKQKFTTEITISIALCTMLFIYAPLELYFTNKEEFWFDIYILLPAVLVVFLTLFALSILAFVICEKIHPKLRQVSCIAYFIAYICSYIQGNFLVNKLPPLDGTAIEWNKYPVERIKSVAVWVCVTVIVLILWRAIHINKLNSAIKIICSCLTLILLITLVTLCITSNGLEDKPNVAVSVKDEFEMSTDSNFIILCLDATDSQTFNMLLETIHPEYADFFEDFTYFRNTMGVYSFTKHSIPYILSGDWYENDESFKDYISNVYKNSGILDELEERYYKVGIYEADIPYLDNDYLKFQNVLPNEYGVTSWWDFTKWYFQMVGFKYAPFDLKRICFVNPEYFLNLKIPPEDYSVFTSSNESFYNSVKNNEITITEDKCFKFIHISGAHLPFQYDADMNIIENATYENNVEASITIAKEYLNRLKENNVYDNSVIIVMADHGFSADYNDKLYELWRTNPIFLVKGVGEKHGMEISDAPISYTDLQEAYGRLLNGIQSEGIFDYEEGDSRERRYLFYHYNVESPIYEYVQSGMAWERNTLTPTGREYIWE